MYLHVTKWETAMKKLPMWLAWWLSLLCGIALAASPTVKTSKDVYGADEEVVVQFSGLPGNKKDVITITLPQALPVKFGQQKQYSDGKADGEMKFGKMPAGKYEVRVYFNYPAGGYQIHARYPFEVSAAPPPAAPSLPTTDGGRISLPGAPKLSAQQQPAADGKPGEPVVVPPFIKPEKDVYFLTEDVVIEFGGFPPDQTHVIALADEGTREDMLPDTWKYNDKQLQGKMKFASNLFFPARKMEARLYLNVPYGRDTVVERYSFEIKDPPSKLKTDKDEYPLGDPVIVQFSDLPGYSKDWIALTPADKGDEVYDKTGKLFRNSDGATEGEMSFADVPGGDYEARLYYNFPLGKFIVKARYPFKVIDPNPPAEEESTEEGGEESSGESTEEKTE
jgi:hypothetical protein